MFREGLLVVVSGPSGTGKGTVLSCIRQKENRIKFSVSATTREPRSGEVDGVNYFFKTTEEFEAMIENGELIEWVKYCDNYYGTPKKYVADTIKSGYDCLLEIEVEGALNIKKIYPDCVSIFILPPSFEELRRRIESRGTEKPEVIEKRMEKALKEMNYVDRYDYVVVNDDIEKAVDSIRYILASEKLKFSRNRDILKTIGIS
ncbi:guanylate kinase [Acetivibrio clariflavus]|uniref:Guanylate kinase n=1 Tax=Acetivibrio clariflavus (strain DSM 19732 / NBRC 101661 / EBR45) TaxID=720554 RepID=G8M303_ACECE|nr:guanylate kinase [Acetivibrio clariflavus]AEV69312.1 guanylate kinase [Acetivibrio clariflavus DSM 19732]